MPTPVPLAHPRTGATRPPLLAGREAEVADAVQQARSARGRWSALSPGQRAEALLNLAAVMTAWPDGYVLAEQIGTGKPEVEAHAEVAAAADVFRFFAAAGRSTLAPAGGGWMAGRESWVRWEPLGVVAAIVPWNYPLLMAAWRAAPALAAGNTVVLKPAETTSESAELLATDAASVLGPGVLVTLPGDRETGRQLVCADVDAVAFTGSAAGGLDVAGRAGVRPVSLELGGNCAALVLPDAPADTFARLARAATYNAGQSCAAPARVITLDGAYDWVVTKLANAMRAHRAGTGYGPLNSARQLARLQRIVASSAATVRHEGLIEPGAGDGAGGYWCPPIVLAGVAQDDPAVQEEVFGPVLTVQSAPDLAGAVALAGGVPQALASSVWSTDVSRALDVARALDVGEVWVNCVLDQTPELPHGGRRQSGHGTDLSALALDDYRRPKTITVATAG